MAARDSAVIASAYGSIVASMQKTNSPTITIALTLHWICFSYHSTCQAWYAEGNSLPLTSNEWFSSTAQMISITSYNRASYLNNEHNYGKFQLWLVVMHRKQFLPIYPSLADICRYRYRYRYRQFGERKWVRITDLYQIRQHYATLPGKIQLVLAYTAQQG